MSALAFVVSAYASPATTQLCKEGCYRWCAENRPTERCRADCVGRQRARPPERSRARPATIGAQGIDPEIPHVWAIVTLGGVEWPLPCERDPGRSHSHYPAAVTNVRDGKGASRGETPFLTHPNFLELAGRRHNTPTMWLFRGRSEKRGTIQQGIATPLHLQPRFSLGGALFFSCCQASLAPARSLRIGSIGPSGAASRSRPPRPTG